ncbi:MAG: hypothetical protein LQ349_005597 [Xanthoria aureola]|nr:MAG: hypothetical protein LQ349_005597 [Xanthoria aureola]
MDEAVGGSRAELLDGPNCCVLQVVDEMARDPGEQRIVNSDFETILPPAKPLVGHLVLLSPPTLGIVDLSVTSS